MRIKVLKISDHKDGCLTFDLLHILIAIDIVGANYEWDILYIEPELINSELVNVNNITYECNFHVTSIKWEELIAISKWFIQIRDCHVIGKSKDDTVDIVAFDTSFWEIRTTNVEIHNAICKAFHEIEISETEI